MHCDLYDDNLAFAYMDRCDESVLARDLHDRGEDAREPIWVLRSKCPATRKHWMNSNRAGLDSRSFAIQMARTKRVAGRLLHPNLHLDPDPDRLLDAHADPEFVNEGLVHFSTVWTRAPI